MARKPDERIQETFQSFLDSIEEPYGPDMADRDLRAALAFYRQDGARWRAFGAISTITNKILHDDGTDNENFDGIDPEASISVPWWAVRAIHLGWREFEDSDTQAEKKLTLGKAFEVERPERGKSSLYERQKLNMRDMRIAILVALKGPPVDLAIQEVAIEGGLSERTVTTAWTSYREEALNFNEFMKVQNKDV